MLLKRQQSLNDALVADLDKMRTEVGSLRSQLEAVRAAQTSVDVLVEKLKAELNVDKLKEGLDVDKLKQSLKVDSLRNALSDGLKAEKVEGTVEALRETAGTFGEKAGSWLKALQDKSANATKL